MKIGIMMSMLLMLASAQAAQTVLISGEGSIRDYLLPVGEAVLFILGVYVEKFLRSKVSSMKGA